MKDNRSLVDAQEWNPIESDKFWEEISPDGHVVQIYENENDLLDLLESYVSGGIEANDCVILLATKPHLISLEARLQTSGYSIDRYITRHQYFPLDAEQFLQQFMVNDMPDELLFMEAVTAILGEARENHRNVRAFVEMVSILWSAGNQEATARLEELWNLFCENNHLSLFCAYPKSSLSESHSSSVMQICCSHSQIITANQLSKTDLFYKNIAQQILV